MQVNWDLHALAPMVVVTATIVVVLIADFFFEYRERFKTYQLAAFGTLLAIVPVLTLAHAGGDRSLFGGAYIVDNDPPVYAGATKVGQAFVSAAARAQRAVNHILGQE